MLIARGKLSIDSLFGRYILHALALVSLALVLAQQPARAREVDQSRTQSPKVQAVDLNRNETEKGASPERIESTSSLVGFLFIGVLIVSGFSFLAYRILQQDQVLSKLKSSVEKLEKTHPPSNSDTRLNGLHDKLRESEEKIAQAIESARKNLDSKLESMPVIKDAIFKIHDQVAAKPVDSVSHDTNGSRKSGSTPNGSSSTAVIDDLRKRIHFVASRLLGPESVNRVGGSKSDLAPSLFSFMDWLHQIDRLFVDRVQAREIDDSVLPDWRTKLEEITEGVLLKDSDSAQVVVKTLFVDNPKSSNVDRKMLGLYNPDASKRLPEIRLVQNAPFAQWWLEVVDKSAVIQSNPALQSKLRWISESLDDSWRRDVDGGDVSIEKKQNMVVKWAEALLDERAHALLAVERGAVLTVEDANSWNIFLDEIRNRLKQFDLILPGPESDSAPNSTVRDISWPVLDGSDLRPVAVNPQVGIDRKNASHELLRLIPKTTTSWRRAFLIFETQCPAEFEKRRESLKKIQFQLECVESIYRNNRNAVPGELIGPTKNAYWEDLWALTSNLSEKCRVDCQNSMKESMRQLLDCNAEELGGVYGRYFDPSDLARPALMRKNGDETECFSRGLYKS